MRRCSCPPRRLRRTESSSWLPLLDDVGGPAAGRATASIRARSDGCDRAGAGEVLARARRELERAVVQEDPAAKDGRPWAAARLPPLVEGPPGNPVMIRDLDGRLGVRVDQRE